MMRKAILLILGLVILLQAGEAKWLVVGSLHNFYMSNGSEWEHALIAEQQAGFRFPAFFPNQDSQAAKGLWIGVKNFKDPNKINPDGSYYEWAQKVSACGPRSYPSHEQSIFMPTKHLLYAAGELPIVKVNNISANEFSDLDEYDIMDYNEEYTLGADRHIYNEVLTSVGITMKRRLYSYAHSIYGNMIFHDYTFVNTGYYKLENGEPVMVDLTKTSQNLEDVYFTFQFRNAISLEGGNEGKEPNAYTWNGRPGWGAWQHTRWGRNTLNDILGENQDTPVLNSSFNAKDTDPGIGVDYALDNGEYLRCSMSWYGKHNMTQASVAYDPVGAPNVAGYQPDGRLGAWQYMGIATLHADVSSTDKSDDITQPKGSTYIDSDDLTTKNISTFDAGQMEDQYNKYMAKEHGEKSHAELVGTGYSHSFGNAGGESSVISYGPYDMAIGDSIHIVFVEGGAGIHRAFSTDEKDPRFEIGNNWYKRIIKKETLTGLQYPDYASGGSLTSIDLDSDANADLYKDAWVYTGRDSLLQSFKYAYNLYNNSGFEIPDDEKAPVAPQEFLLEAYSRSIRLTWTDEINVVNNNFSGYKIYRAVGDYKYTKYDLVVDLSYSNGGLSEGKTTFTYDDKTVTRGQKYYYTIVAYDNGDNAFAKVLTSQAHLTRTNIGVSLSTPGANAMDNIRIVPNPWNEKMQVLQYAGSANKYMLQFVNLPDVCHIRVFNTRGDLIKKLEHEKGSEERWNLSTDYNQIISSGVYIVQFEAVEDVYSDQNELSISKGEVVNKKLVVIR